MKNYEVGFQNLKGQVAKHITSSYTNMRLRSHSNGMQCPPPGRASASGPTPSRGFFLSGEFKAHCNDVVSVAERISRLFSRKQTYHVQRNHKSMSLMSLNEDQPVYSINNNDFLTKDQELEYKKIHLSSKFGNHLEVTPLSIRHGSEPFLNKLPPEKRKFSHILPESNKRWSLDPACRMLNNKNMHVEQREDLNTSPEPSKRWSFDPTFRIGKDTLSKERHDDILNSTEASKRSNLPSRIEAEKENMPICYTTLKRQDSNISFDDNVFICSEDKYKESLEKSPITPSLRKSALNRFSRDSSRCSVQLLDSPNKARWADAADRVIMGKTPEQQMLYIPPPTPSQDSSHTSITNFSVVLLKRQEQLGIHVIQSTDDMTGQDRGLLIEEIEPDGRIAKDQRIHLHDIIVNVNNQSLIGISFERAKEIFSNAMQESELHLQIVRNKNFAPAESSSEGNEYTKFGKAPSTPQKVSSFNRKSNIQQGNTRKIGTRITVSLTKGQYGFGFSITTRDNHLGGEVLVYIKSILPKGSAIEDGNLRVGDRLLKINGIEVTGLNQADIVTMLRNIPQEGQAVLTLSRQGAGYENTDQNEHPLNLPKKGNTSNSDLLEGMPSEKSPEDNLTFPWKPRKILSFRIPVHSSEKDGIGIKVKGKAVSKYDGYKDLGIFVKSIIEGGAAAEDGQLQLNDQLININGMSLLEKSNNDAMKIIYTAMNQNVEHEIFLTIARRFDGCDKSSSNISGISSDIEIDSSPRLTSTPNQNIKKENSQNLSQKMLSLNNFVDSEISNVSCDSTIIYDEQNYSDFNEYEVNECPGTSFRSVSDNTVISEDSNLSQVSIEKSELGFSRDELWRQSMSEKRPATLDGKNTDTLQRNKKAREERERQRLLLMQENVLNDENEIQHLSPKRSLSVNEEDLTRLCFNSTNEHNKPFFLNSTEEYEAKSNKKSVMFNSLSSIFKFNKSNHRQIEKEEYVSGSHQKTCSADLYLNGEEETGVLY